MKHTIVIVGSSNTDMVIKTSKIPVPGETVLGGTFLMNAGGKGGNQAVAASRLGGNIFFVCKVGNDMFGKQALETFQKEGIDTSYIITDTLYPSGVALVTVDQKGENAIVVAPGANKLLTPVDIISSRKIIEKAILIVVQLETPIQTVDFLADIAQMANVTMVLNPAPATRLSDDLLRKITIITPNQVEAQMLTGIEIVDAISAEKAAEVLHSKGVQTVIITMGAQGALLFHENTATMVESPKVEVIDTTAAGDVFNAALAVALAEGKEMKEAVAFACTASAISVTRLGAQSSAPYRKEVEAVLAGKKLPKNE